MGLTRRQFLGYAAIAATAKAKTTQAKPAGFFTVGQRDDHWWLITPDGEPFFSLGLNHIDPASLRYPENIHIWRDKYQISLHRLFYVGMIVGGDAGSGWVGATIEVRGLSGRIS